MNEKKFWKKVYLRALAGYTSRDPYHCMRKATEFAADCANSALVQHQMAFPDKDK